MTQGFPHNEQIFGLMGHPVTIAGRPPSNPKPPPTTAARTHTTTPTATDQPAAEQSSTLAGLTARIAKGDDHAFGLFYDAWFDRALAIARHITKRDEPTCLDIVQTAMLRAARTLPALKDDDSVTRWMTRALHHAAIDRFRADTRAAQREHAAASRDATQQRAGRASTQPAELTERLAWLRDQLEAIPPPDRAALLARVAGSRPLAHIGQMLGSTTAAAHGRVRRTLEKLRTQAREHFDD